MDYCEYDDCDLTTEENAELEGLLQEIQADESRTSVLNERRMRDIMTAYSLMKRIAAENSKNACLTYKLHEPFGSMGSISLTGKEITLKHVSWFMKATKLASNFEIYPLTNGNLKMTLTFHGLTKAID